MLGPDRLKLDGGEFFEAVQSRAGAFIEDLLKRHGDGKILVAAHPILESRWL